MSNLFIFINLFCSLDSFINKMIDNNNNNHHIYLKSDIHKTYTNNITENLYGE